MTELKLPKKIIVPGTFDFVHEGHHELLLDALRISRGILPLYVLVNGDEMVESRKEITLSMNEVERARAIAKRYPAEGVYVKHSIEDLKEFISRDPCIVLHGGDYNLETISKLYGVPESWWRERDVLLVFTPRTAGVSSTMLRSQREKKEE